MDLECLGVVAGDARYRAALPESHPEAGQILLQGLPQRGVVVGIGNVEDQPLAGAEEVDVEHGRQLRGRQLGGAGEEAARKYLESQMPSGLGEVDALQK